MLETASDVVEDYCKRTFRQADDEDRTFELGRFPRRLIVVGSLRTLTAAALDGAPLDVTSIRLQRINAGEPAYAVRLPYAIAGDELTITGDWGWETVPSGVQEAVIEIAMVQHFRELNRMADVNQAAENVVQLSRKALPPLAAQYLRRYRVPAIA